MLPKYLSIKIAQDATFDGKETYKAVIAVNDETWAFRGDGFADVYGNTVKSIEEWVKAKTAGTTQGGA